MKTVYAFAAALVLSSVCALSASEQTLSEKLERPIDVCFRRDYFCDVVDDLKVLGGIDIAYPADHWLYCTANGAHRHFGAPGDEFFTFSLEGRGLKLRDVLDQLAKASGMQLDFRGQTVVLWRKMDDAAFTALKTRCESPSPTERLSAVRAAIEGADPRIYPLLFRALKDTDRRVSDLAFNGLREHSRTFRFGEGIDDAVETLLAKWQRIKPAVFSANNGMNGNELDVTRVLCASHSKKAARLLADEITTVNFARNGFIARDLAKSATEELLDPLLEIAQKKEFAGPKDQQFVNKEGSPSEFAAMALVGIDSPRAFTEFLKIADRNPPYLSNFMPYLLIDSPDPRAIDRLLAMAAKGDQGAAVCALSRCREPRVLDAAFWALQTREHAMMYNDPPESIFREERFVKELLRQAATAKDALALSLQLGATCDARVEDALVSAARLNDATWGEIPIMALARIGDERSRDEVMKMLRDPGLQARAVKAVAQEPRAEPIVRRALKEGDSALRSALAAQLLPHTQWAFGCACWTPQVIALLDDPDASVRNEAFKALSQQADPRAIEAIAVSLKSSDPSVRRAVAEGFSTNDDPGVVEPLLRAVADPDESVCVAAVLALGGFNPAAADPAANPLGYLVAARRGYDSRLVETLLPLLDDRREKLRNAALKTLPLVAGIDDWLKLKPAWNDARAEVRRAAVGAILGSTLRVPPMEPFKITAVPAWPEVRDALLILIHDKDSDVRRDAMSIVTSVDEQLLNDAMIALLKDADPALRRDAVEAYGQEPRFYKQVVSALADTAWNGERARSRA